MNLIFLSSKLLRARTVSLSGRRVLFIATLLLATPFIAGLSVYHYMNANAASLPNFARQFFLSAHDHQLRSLALQLSRMEAQVLRLNALSKHVGAAAGINLNNYQFNEPPAQGGALSGDLSFSHATLANEVNRLNLTLTRSEYELTALRFHLFDQALQENARPSSMPIAAAWQSSSFGWRFDPFSGGNAFHEGIDFPANTGDAILAAASGIVSFSNYHPSYGNIVEIDHGNGYVSRYAHASKRLVQFGEIVIRGQKIAEVGSTGRSTGPHLHFEVRHNGVAEDPARLLQELAALKMGTR